MLFTLAPVPRLLYGVYGVYGVCGGWGDEPGAAFWQPAYNFSL